MVLFMNIMMIMFFFSCKKEGVYNPDKKIDAIYTEQLTLFNGDTLINTGKLISERWIWDNNLLVQIDFCSGDHVYASQRIEYENKQISKIIMNDYYLLCTYEKRKLTKIDGFSNDEKLISKFRFLERDDKGRITKMRIEAPYQINKSFDEINLALRLLLPETTLQNMEYTLSEISMAKADYVAEIVLRYENDNVVEEKWTTSDGISSVQYTYDNKNNPFYKALFLLDNHSMLPFSKNNYLSINRFNRLNSYTYQYEDDYPVKQTNTEEYDSGAMIISSVYYEYR